MSILDRLGFASLGADTNKQKTDEIPENESGIISDKLPELELNKKDEDILELTNKWEKEWLDSAVRSEWLKQIEENEKYWLGNQFGMPEASDVRPMVDNILFESVETYLPQATRRNPEPLVTLKATEKETPQKEEYTQKVKNRLADIADEGKLRLKLKKTARHWLIYRLGVGKIGWDLDKDMPILRIIRPQKMILDPKATIDEDGYTGYYVGEHRRLRASEIITRIESDAAKAWFKAKVDDNLGTEVQFKEWWTDDYVCWTLDDHVLFKAKNLHWNYDKKIKDTVVDEYGNETETENEKEGNNHIAHPTKPYVFLSVFNLGKKPMDDTSLISQNLSNQDLINKRNKQIDKNADSMNGGLVISGEYSGLTQSQAEKANRALRKGGSIFITKGTPREAIDRMTAPSLPPDVYNQLIDTRARLRDIFGVKGSTQAGLQGENTVRGKLISRNLDTDRIGGGVSEYLEQFADDVYNWFVQMLYVYDTAFQFIDGAIPAKILVSVKEGSLLPKDTASVAGQALDLARLGRISTLDLMKRLEMPNPEEMAANVWLEAEAPELLYKNNPDIQQVIQSRQQAQQAQMQAEQQRELMKEQIRHQNDMDKEEFKAKVDIEKDIISAEAQAKQPAKPKTK